MTVGVVTKSEQEEVRAAIATLAVVLRLGRVVHLGLGLLGHRVTFRSGPDTRTEGGLRWEHPALTTRVGSPTLTAAGGTVVKDTTECQEPSKRGRRRQYLERYPRIRHQGLHQED